MNEEKEKDAREGEMCVGNTFPGKQAEGWMDGGWVGVGVGTDRQ